MTLSVYPAPRWSAVMAELPTSNELVLFGGKTTAQALNSNTAYNGLLNDTWTWNGSAWTSISTGSSGGTLTGPAPRFEAAIAYDGTNVTLVGGSDGHINLSDTWSYSAGGGWAKQSLTDSVSPPSNYTIPTMQRGSSMAYQSGVSGGEVVLFGGISSFQRHYVMDTWTWVKGSPGTWTQLSPANSPKARTYAAMASSSATAVLFGGKNFDGPLSDTWTWNGTNWTQATPTTSPSARYGAMMAYDGYHSQWVLFGGITANGYSDETWTYNGTTWTQITSGPTPPARAFSAMAFLTANNTTVMFGGLGYDRSYSDTWVFNGSVWAQM